MKKIRITIFVAMILAFMSISGCGDSKENKTIKIAVTGSPEVYSEYFEKGIKRAYDKVCQEYKDSGYDIELEFYNDEDNYETGNRITAELVRDKELTAIIASSSPDICDAQIYQTDKAGKILICPHWLNDKTLEKGNYKKVFSLNYSNKSTGLVMKEIAEHSEAKKWVLCYSDDTISRDEAAPFFSLTDGEGIEVVDSVKINSLVSDFDRTVERWKLLGIEGVIFIPYDDEGFELLYKLKKEIPQLCVVSDSSMDNHDIITQHKKEFDNLYIVAQFNTFDADSKFLEDGEEIDTWEIHGYNTVRMIVDTAIKNNTVSCDKIAEILHKDGYFGDLENFKFQDNGMAVYSDFNYIKFKEEIMESYFILSDSEDPEQGIVNGKVQLDMAVPWIE